ncbi:hypothetical protein [Embleya sp. NPDC005575]|uniref:hypothetical protein n=1 Tax=Embleya sp. NPDC005575 TaxID=3156892 RepID=UPI00339DC707
MSNPPPHGGPGPHPETSTSPEQREALERIAAAGGSAGAWLSGLGRPGGPTWALAGAVEHTLGGLSPYGPAEVGPRPGLPHPQGEFLPYLDPYESPAGPVVGAVPLALAETVAVVTLAGCARIATRVMTCPGWVEQLHVLAEAIDDAIEHATHPDHTLEHLLGPRSSGRPDEDGPAQWR